MDPSERFETLVAEFADLPGVIPPGATKGFGSGALRIQGRIFAMLVRGHLVVKLPAGRVAELVDAGEGTFFDANKGTPMKNWLSLGADSTRDWSELAREALAFVGGSGGPRR